MTIMYLMAEYKRLIKFYSERENSEKFNDSDSKIVPLDCLGYAIYLSKYLLCETEGMNFSGSKTQIIDDVQAIYPIVETSGGILAADISYPYLCEEYDMFLYFFLQCCITFYLIEKEEEEKGNQPNLKSLEEYEKIKELVFKIPYQVISDEKQKFCCCSKTESIDSMINEIILFTDEYSDIFYAGYIKSSSYYLDVCWLKSFFKKIFTHYICGCNILELKEVKRS